MEFDSGADSLFLAEFSTGTSSASKLIVTFRLKNSATNEGIFFNRNFRLEHGFYRSALINLVLWFSPLYIDNFGDCIRFTLNRHVLASLVLVDFQSRISFIATHLSLQSGCSDIETMGLLQIGQGWVLRI